MDQIKYKSGYKYQLCEDYTINIKIFPEKDIVTEYIELTNQGCLTIKKGYAWDGASGPAIDTKTIMRGSLVHDALYQLMRQGHLAAKDRKQADIELKLICIKDGMCKIRVWYVYRSVRKHADYAADPKNKKSILYAP